MALIKQFLTTGLLVGAMAVTSSAMAQSITIGSDTILAADTASIPVSYASEGDNTIFGITAVVDYDETNVSFSSCTQGTAPVGVTLTCSDDGNAVTVGALSLGGALTDIDPVATIDFTYSGAATPPPNIDLPLTFGAGTVCSDQSGQAVNCAQNAGQITVTDIILDPGDIDVTPLTLTFDPIAPMAQDVTIANVAAAGADDINVSAINLTGNFEITGTTCAGGTLPITFPFALTAQDSCAISVAPTAAAVEGDTGTATVSSDDQDEPQVDVALAVTAVVVDPGEIDVTPLTLTFDPMAPMAQDVTIANVAAAGAADINVSDIAVAGNFEITATTCAGGTLPITFPFALTAQGSCAISMAPTAAAVEGDTGTVTVSSDDADEPAVEVTLSLGAIAAPVAIPTLSQWSMILVASMLAMLAMFGMRRKEG